MSLRSRVVNVFRSRSVDDDLREEMEFHIAERAAANERAGMAAEEAEQQARRKLGNQLLIRESSRDVKLIPWIESVARDVQFGLRMLRKNVVLTSATVLSLSLAVGACAAAFSLIDALILRPLPVPNPHELFYLTYPSGNPATPTAESDSFNYPLYERLRTAAAGRADLALMAYTGPRPARFPDRRNAPEMVFTQVVSGTALPMLGIRPAMGRLLGPDDDRTPGKHPVAVISYDFWKRRFGRDPSALGRWFTFMDHQFQIIGVTERGFTGVEPGSMTDIWVPAMMYNNSALTQAGWHWFRIWGRRKAGIQPAQVTAVLQPVFYNFRRERAGLIPADAPREVVQRLLRADLRVTPAASGMSFVRKEAEKPMWVLSAVVGLVLLIACGNVGCLFIARAAAREREMALRMSIGAGRARLVQQMLVECVIVTLASCALGALFAWWTAPVIVHMMSTSRIPTRLDLHFDFRLILFLSALAGFITFLFGVAPAFRASGVKPVEALKAGGGKQVVRIGIFRPLVAAQVAFSFVVLFLAGLFVTSFGKLSQVDVGFDPKDLLVIDIEAKDLKEPGPKAQNLWNQLADRVRELPGVQGVSYSGWGLFTGSIWTGEVRVPGRPAEDLERRFLAVSPRFIETMRMRLKAGRDFRAQEVDRDPTHVVIINEAFRDHYFPGENPVGKTFFTLGVENKPITQEIVGMVANAKYTELRERATPTIYVPARPGGNISLQVRTAMDPAPMGQMLRKELPRVHPAFNATDVARQSTLIDDTVIRERLLAVLSAFFGIVATLLASVGLYGVLTYIVVQRRKEIGIRVALGARPPSVAASILGDIALVGAAGVLIGTAGGLGVARWFTTMLFEVKPSDVASIAIPLLVLLGASAIASVVPALQAMRVDPMVALRYE